MKHLNFYIQCMETGYLLNKNNDEEHVGTGLCGAAAKDQICPELLSNFVPTWEDEEKIRRNNETTGWWAFGKPVWFNEATAVDVRYQFTELRQTIVLFMAAMNDEL